MINWNHQALIITICANIKDIATVITLHTPPQPYGTWYLITDFLIVDKFFITVLFSFSSKTFLPALCTLVCLCLWLVERNINNANKRMSKHSNCSILIKGHTRHR